LVGERRHCGLTARFTRMSMGAVLLGSLLLPFAFSGAHAAKAVPDAPYYYVLDEAKVLSQTELYAIQTLLIKHDHATGEQFLIAIFDSLEGEDLVQYTNEVFQKWKIGQRGKDNGILLALYWKEHQARIEVGYGLEPTLTDAKSKMVLEEALIPELKNDQPGKALARAAFEILNVIESPLIASGDAEKIIASGAFRQSFGSRPIGSQNAWLLWVVLGIFLVMVALSILTSSDAHFTGEGWFRPRPWNNVRRSRHGGGFGGAWGGGGGGFGGGGFGGFGGGGGRSGGGGASGSW